MAEKPLAEIPTPILGALVELLIAEIDARGGDPDLEDGHDAEHRDAGGCGYWDCPDDVFVGRRK